MSISPIGVGPVAAYVLRSLYEHPGLGIPEAIVAEASAGDTGHSIDVQAVNDGLAELESKGLAEEETGGGWRLTDAGRGEVERVRATSAPERDTASH